MEGRRVVVLYASQTGTAEEVAERIGRELRRRHFRVKVVAMDDYDIVCVMPSLSNRIYNLTSILLSM